MQRTRIAAKPLWKDGFGAVPAGTAALRLRGFRCITTAGIPPSHEFVIQSVTVASGWLGFSRRCGGKVRSVPTSLSRGNPHICLPNQDYNAVRFFEKDVRHCAPCRLLLMTPEPSPSDEATSDSADDPNRPSSRPNDPSLSDVWNTYGDQLRRRARTRLRQYGLTGQTESMDICNDVMADLARRGPTPNTPDEILGYVLRAIDNQVLDTFRTLARQCRDFRRNESGPVEDYPVPSMATTPSRIALRKEVLAKIREELSPDDVRAVDMMLENRDWNEIGRALDVPADTVRMRVRRAIARIRENMNVQPDPPQ